MKQFGQRLVVSGLHWQDDGVAEAYAANALASKVLCERHNNAFSPLDEAAGHFFSRIALAVQHASKFSTLRNHQYYLVNGDAIERWAVKTLLGLYHSKNARLDKEWLAVTHTIDENRLLSYVGDSELPVPMGLFVTHDESRHMLNTIELAPLTHVESRKVTGIVTRMQGVTFFFIFDHFSADEVLRDSGYYRPNVFDLTGPKRTSRILMSWPSARMPGSRVELKLHVTHKVRSPRIRAGRRG